MKCDYCGSEKATKYDKSYVTGKNYCDDNDDREDACKWKAMAEDGQIVDCVKALKRIW